MKRVVTATAGTIVGLILLLGFKTGPAPRTTLPPAAQAPASPGPTTPTPATSASPKPDATRTIDGQAVAIPFGTVQVKVTVTGTRIVSVSAISLPNDNPTSAQISQIAGPQLAQEVLSAQSANINVVSGATFTSDGYAQSLQSALDRLHG
jgi:uncharacterized protein with FMN-binding domain